jgi:hypothetical protein
MMKVLILLVSLLSLSAFANSYEYETSQYDQNQQDSLSFEPLEPQSGYIEESLPEMEPEISML